ncbi:hypothetical protein ABFS82_04G146300 [Erythranthe guttata]|uniref:uncharacterized protein LOC105973473 n=1 Tax=Erythranthe guttata TaxID=4155 RepID=UPI00064DDACE|nr:PREDICTED: uncharacterized protein LOC105973473 [Erythranthe guttata]|eukprot:XP_012853955.1 PREDICTED: uncharacterized protein LOC105973473 [Erythranthe guttata]
MDVWVVAAAAGAGYVAQRLKNLSKGKRLDSFPDNLNIVKPDSSSVRQNVKEKSSPLVRVFSRKQIVEERENEQPCEEEAGSAAEKTSISGYEDETLATMDIFANRMGFLSSEDFRGDWEHRVPSDVDEVFTSDSLRRTSSSEMGFSYGFGRNRSSLRCRRVNNEAIKPQTSLESCLMAQLYDQHAKFEEYTYSSLRRLKKPSLRPFIVTDGSRIISSPPREHAFNGLTGKGECKLRDDIHSQENNTVLGVPKLPNVVSGRDKNVQALRRNGSNEMARRNQNSPQGISDRALIFNLGLTMGIVSSVMANKQEMGKLNKLLKQTENLVQDLQEEIEMKDSVTVKEIAVEDYESKDVHTDNDLLALSSEHNYCEEYKNQKNEEESLSKIEAELEAELERLELTINSSRLEAKLSKLNELDPDSMSDCYEGELSHDLFGAKKTENRAYGESGSSTPRSVNYAVSPRELSLRLHEVIQTRLEERIKELETALENSQMKDKYVESSENIPSENKTQTCSTQESPIISRDGGEEEFVGHPVVINLSGEALSAYNEAYEEMMKESESDEEDLQLGFGNGEIEGFDGRMEEEEEDVCTNDVIGWSSSADESEDDEMERMLIRQIVEKAKQGSPAVLKAHRELLFSAHAN